MDVWTVATSHRPPLSNCTLTRANPGTPHNSPKHETRSVSWMLRFHILHILKHMTEKQEEIARGVISGVGYKSSLLNNDCSDFGIYTNQHDTQVNLLL